MKRGNGTCRPGMFRLTLRCVGPMGRTAIGERRGWRYNLTVPAAVAVALLASTADSDDATLRGLGLTDPDDGASIALNDTFAPGTTAYSTTPVLIETFVETPRYTGAVYKASGWIPVGTTQGRGRYDRHTKRAEPKKDIWLRPLRKDWKRTLNR